MCKHGRRLGAEFGRTEKTISRTKFATDFFMKKFPFYRPKFLTTFIVIDQKFLLDTFFTQFVVSLIFNNSTSQNIGGTDAWAVPPPQIWGGRSPTPPNS